MARSERIAWYTVQVLKGEYGREVTKLEDRIKQLERVLGEKLAELPEPRNGDGNNPQMFG